MSHQATSPISTGKTSLKRGLAVQKAIFGKMIDQMYERSRSVPARKSPQDRLYIQRFLSANCFDDYYTRNGAESLRHLEVLRKSCLSLPHRQLCKLPHIRRPVS